MVLDWAYMYYDGWRLTLNMLYMPIVLQTYDHILTFGLEVDYIWSAPWNSMKVLFFLARYLPWINIASMLTFVDLKGVNIDQCRKWAYIIGGVHVASLIPCEAILTIRAYAVWGQNRAIKILLWILGTCTLAAVSTTTAMHMKSLKFLPPPLPWMERCLYEVEAKSAAASWICMLIYDICILLLLIIPAIKTFQTGGGFSPLQREVFRNGFLYYCYILLITVTHVLLIFNAPSQYRDLLISVETTMYSILTCRAILHIREQSRTAVEARLPGSSTELSTINFAAGASPPLLGQKSNVVSSQIDEAGTVWTSGTGRRSSFSEYMVSNGTQSQS